MVAYSNLVVHVLTLVHAQPFPCPTASIILLVFPFSITMLCSLYHVFLYLSHLLPLNLSPPTPKREVTSRGPRKSPAVGICGFYEGFPPRDLLQKRQVSLKGKVETPSSAMHPAFLPYKALKYTNTTTNPTVHPKSVHWNRSAMMKTTYSFWLDMLWTSCHYSYVTDRICYFQEREPVRCWHRLGNQVKTGFKRPMTFVVLWRNSWVLFES